GGLETPRGDADPGVKCSHVAEQREHGEGEEPGHGPGLGPVPAGCGGDGGEADDAECGAGTRARWGGRGEYRECGERGPGDEPAAEFVAGEHPGEAPVPERIEERAPEAERLQPLRHGADLPPVLATVGGGAGDEANGVVDGDGAEPVLPSVEHGGEVAA